MNVQGAPRFECVATFLTLVGSEITVSPLMFMQCGRFGEVFATRLADIRSFACVNSQVILETNDSGVGFAT